jgi:hypothetical protein
MSPSVELKKMNFAMPKLTCEAEKRILVQFQSRAALQREEVEQEDVQQQEGQVRHSRPQHFQLAGIGNGFGATFLEKSNMPVVENVEIQSVDITNFPNLTCPITSWPSSYTYGGQLNHLGGCQEGSPFFVFFRQIGLRNVNIAPFFPASMITFLDLEILNVAPQLATKGKGNLSYLNVIFHKCKIFEFNYLL